MIWSKASTPECKRYEFKSGEVIERAQDINSLLSYEVYRCEWKHEEQRLSYENERLLLKDCYLEYE